MRKKLTIQYLLLVIKVERVESKPNVDSLLLVSLLQLSGAKSLSFIFIIKVSSVSLFTSSSSVTTTSEP
jgi:hypothetical protein